MKKRFYLLLAVLPVSILIYAACMGKNKNVIIDKEITELQTVDTVQVVKPKMQVVFLLDATGSMSGLIGTAKEKIWSIAGGLTQTNPAPDLEIGMIFYRDKGDAFVTKHIPLGKDLDNMYEQLMVMQADGGGDEPESVNRALHEAVTQIQWDADPKTYRAIFLVGDCPPHMDYQDDVKYPASCIEANKRNIVINTILMGNSSQAMKIWKEIAKNTNGEFIQTDMSVNNISIATPYDKKINDLQYKLDKTRIYYGKSADLMVTKQIQSEKLNESADVSVSARRSEYNMSESGKASYYGSNELVNDAMNKKKIADIPVSDLPDSMKKMSVAERQKYVDKLVEDRKALEKEIVNLNQQRQQHIESEVAEMDEDKVKISFDDVIFKSMKKQAADKDIILEGKAKR